MEKPKVNNIVSTVNLGCKLDLHYVANNVENGQYRPRRFSAATIRNGKQTALVFSNGKLICLGAKTPEDSLQRAKTFVGIIAKLGYDAKLNDFKIHNMVASFDVGFHVQLGPMSDDNGKCVFYEPEIFPALNYYLPKTTVRVFASGKVVILAAKTHAEIEEVYNTICPIIAKYRK